MGYWLGDNLKKKKEIKFSLIDCGCFYEFFEKFKCTGDNIKKRKNIKNLLRYLKNKINLYLSSIFFIVFLKILFCVNERELLKRQIRNRTIISYLYFMFFKPHGICE